MFENLTTESMRELKDPKYLAAKHPKLLNVVDTALDMFNADFTVIRRVFVRYVCNLTHKLNTVNHLSIAGTIR